MNKHKRNRRTCASCFYFDTCPRAVELIYCDDYLWEEFAFHEDVSLKLDKKGNLFVNEINRGSIEDFVSYGPHC